MTPNSELLVLAFILKKVGYLIIIHFFKIYLEIDKNMFLWNN